MAILPFPSAPLCYARDGKELIIIQRSHYVDISGSLTPAEPVRFDKIVEKCFNY